MIGLRSFIYAVVALAGLVFCLVLFGPAIFTAAVVDQVANKYEAAGLDVSDCKKRPLTSYGNASCLEQPMRDITSKLPPIGPPDRDE